MTSKSRAVILGYDMTGAAIVGIRPRWWTRAYTRLMVAFGS